ncbi:hypothetical protein [Williamsia maris]|uniref:hypothetical protein n=1 Tax=Williamsia maris TaxID=72806 RepID=UPI0020A3BD89|nr:hypothetical protein [Williamsia maris]
MGIVIYVIATSASGSARAFILVLAATGVLWSFYWGFGLLKRTDEEKELGVPMIIRSGTTPEARDRGGWAGVTAGIVAAPVVLFAQIFVVGAAAALVISLLQKYISIEEFEAVTGKKAPRRRAKPKLWSKPLGK